MFERILVALDGATPTEIVLPYSEELAAKFGAEIMLISVLEPTAEDRDHLYRSYLEHIAQQVEGELEDWGAEKGPRCGVRSFSVDLPRKCFDLLMKKM